MNDDDTPKAHSPMERPASSKKSDARVGGMVATVALILMFVFFGLIIWIS